MRLLLSLLAGLALATTDKAPGKVTVWDSIMADQSVRHLQIGAEAFARGDYDMATRYFARAVASNPEDPRTHLMLGVAQYWSGKVDESMAAYREVLKLDPKSAHAHQLIGIAWAWKGDMEAALKEFQTAAELDPERADIQMDLGSVLESMGERAKALDAFRRAAYLDPKFALYHYQLGVLYDKLGRDADAKDSLKEALRIYPDFQDALLQLGSVRQRANDLDDAASMFKKAVRLKPGDAVARLRLGFVHLLQGRPEKVSDDLERAFQLTPESEGGRLALSQAYGGPQPEAAAPEDKTPVGMFRRNLERVPPAQEAKIEVTITRINRKPVLQAEPKTEGSNLQTALGRNFGSQQQSGASRTQRQFSLPPASPEVRKKQIEQIVSELRQSAGSSSPDAEVHLGMNISYPHREMDSRETDHPVSYEPRRVGNDLGLWVQGTGWIELVEEVVPLIEQRLVEHPTDLQAKILLGLAYLTLGNGPEARKEFEAALAENPKDLDALLGLGVACVLTGDDAMALETYKKALSIKPKDKTAKDAVKWLSTPVPG